MSNYIASVFLDGNGQYAKAPELVAVVRLYTGEGCDHEQMSVAEFNRLSTAEQYAIKRLPGRPECIGV